MSSTDLIRSKIRDIPDFPKPGILFRDITPLWQDGSAFESCMEIFSARYFQNSPQKPELIVGIESRGFVIGSVFAARHAMGFVPIRKKGKLPHVVESHEYELEYGSDCVEIHMDAVSPGQKVLIMDDLLATGGTMLAAIHLLEKIGADILGCAVVIDLPALGGRKKIEDAGYEVFSILDY